MYLLTNMEVMKFITPQLLMSVTNGALVVSKLTTMLHLDHSLKEK